MLQFLSAVTSPATIFASTNIDDLIVVSGFFAERRLHWRTIVASQFLGIGVLVLLSALMAVAALTLPAPIFRYLGVVPLGLGVARLWEQCLAGRRNLSAQNSRPRPSAYNSGLFAATTVTIATGSDNLSVYVPFFAKAPERIPFYAATFALLAGVWCLLGYVLVKHQMIGGQLRKLGPVLMPTVMILIGLWLLTDSLR